MPEYVIPSTVLISVAVLVFAVGRYARRWKIAYEDQCQLRQLLVRRAPGLFVVSDVQGRIRDTSRSFDERFGIVPETGAPPERLHDILSERSRYDYDNIIQYTFRTHRSVREFRVTTATDVPTTELLMSVDPVVRPDGRGIGLIHEFAGPDKLTRSGMDFEHLEKLTNVGRIASGIAHELNTPLGSIILSADLLADMELSDPMCAEAQKIKNQAVHCSHVVKELLRYVKKDENIKRRARVSVLIDQAHHLVQAELANRRVTLDVRLNTEEDALLCDENQMEQLLINLFSNSLHAIGEDGRITVSVDRDALLNQIVLTFEDDGCGIEPEITAQIFDPFFTTKPGSKGTGLGLALCQRIVHEHDGTIEVQSTPGAGATFILRFPMAT